jgi:alcohol dehydrogenase YqhD (iron-dependent ADH family)
MQPGDGIMLKAGCATLSRPTSYELYMKDYNPGTFARWAREVWAAGSVEEGVARMRRTFQGWDAPVTLEELGVSEADIPAIVVAAQKVGVLGRLKELTPGDLEAILRLALSARVTEPGERGNH